LYSIYQINILVNLFPALYNNKVIQKHYSKVSHSSRSDLYTESEKQVLLLTSKINNKDYVPFMDVDLLER